VRRLRDFGWLIGGSLPLWITIQSVEGEVRPHWTPGDADVWLWDPCGPDEQLTDEDVVAIARFVTGELQGSEAAAKLHISRDYVAVNVTDTPIPMQFIECSRAHHAARGITTRGTAAVGACVMDTFDLSCCAVGIVSLSIERVKAYNSVLGEKHTSFVDPTGTARFYALGGAGRPCGL
jgi:hypothetical protein